MSETGKTTRKSELTEGAPEGTSALIGGDSRAVLPELPPVEIGSEEYVTIWRENIGSEKTGNALAALLRGERQKPERWQRWLGMTGCLVALLAVGLLAPSRRAEYVKSHISGENLSRQRDNATLYADAEKSYGGDEFAITYGKLRDKAGELIERGDLGQIRDNRKLLCLYFDSAARSGRYDDPASKLREQIDRLCELDPDTPQWALAHAVIFTGGNCADDYYSRVEPSETAREKVYSEEIRRLDKMRSRLADRQNVENEKRQLELYLARLLVIDWQLRAFIRYGDSKWGEDADSAGVSRRERAYRIAENYENAVEFLELRRFICLKIADRERFRYYFGGESCWLQSSKLEPERKKVESMLKALAPAK